MRKYSTRINADELRAKLARKVTLAGVDTVIAPSPYDIPQELRASVSPDSQHVVVEMRYLSEDEEFERIQPGEKIGFDVGKSSGRIKRVFFSLEALRKEIGAIQIDQAVYSAVDVILKEYFLREHRPRPEADFRYEISKNLLTDRSKPFLRQVVPCF